MLPPFGPRQLPYVWLVELNPLVTLLIVTFKSNSSHAACPTCPPNCGLGAPQEQASACTLESQCLGE